MAIVRGNSSLTHYRGDTYTIQFTVLDYDEQTDITTPFDLTGFELAMSIKANALEQQTIVKPTLDIFDPTNGRFRWVITKPVSDQIGTQNGVYDIELIRRGATSDEDQFVTFLTGTWIVTQDVTRSTDTSLFEQARVISRMKNTRKDISLDAAIEKVKMARANNNY